MAAETSHWNSCIIFKEDLFSFLYPDNKFRRVCGCITLRKRETNTKQLTEGTKSRWHNYFSGVLK